MHLIKSRFAVFPSSFNDCVAHDVEKIEAFVLSGIIAKFSLLLDFTNESFHSKDKTEYLNPRHIFSIEAC